FSLMDFQRHWQAVATRSCRMTRRMMLEVAVFDVGLPVCGGMLEQAGNGIKPELPEPIFHAVALNDAVIAAGPPFRMIEVDLAIDPHVHGCKATTFNGDGVVVATPSGSTAYNLAAGGPIVSPGIDGVCVTVICPYSLAARPIVCPGSSDIWLSVNLANEGSTLVLDGQESCKLHVGQQVLIRKHERPLTLIHNPELNYWTMLASKLRWAVAPTSQ
ncbi:MAG: NAD(+)/NADH kinase, partial [Rhodospirillales bacterium]|nr:NAD(+)/NADH kinase [Rhodospirillales bacterium]